MSPYVRYCLLITGFESADHVLSSFLRDFDNLSKEMIVSKKAIQLEEIKNSKYRFDNENLFGIVLIHYDDLIDGVDYNLMNSIFDCGAEAVIATTTFLPSDEGYPFNQLPNRVYPVVVKREFAVTQQMINRALNEIKKLKPNHK